MDNGESSYRRFRSGDDTGMTELVNLYGYPLILYLNNYVDDMAVAEDLMQETFIKLAVRKPKYNSEKSSFKTWLYAIGRNIALNYLKKYSRHKKVSLEEHTGLESSSDIEAESLINERNLTLYKTLGSLKSEYRQVIYLKYFEGFDNTEISGIMRKSRRQTENLLYNAKKTLKSELERRGFVYEEM